MILHKRFYPAENATQQRSIEPAFGRLAVRQVVAVLARFCLAPARHVIQPQIFQGDCFASGLTLLRSPICDAPNALANLCPAARVRRVHASE